MSLAQDADEDPVNHIVLANDNPLDFSSQGFDEDTLQLYSLVNHLDINIDCHYVPPRAARLPETQAQILYKNFFKSQRRASVMRVCDKICGWLGPGAARPHLGLNAVGMCLRSVR